MPSRCALHSILLVAFLIAGTAAKGYADDEPLKLRDISQMKQKRLPVDKIVEKITEQGISFEVTPGVAKQLSRMGFDDDQIDVIKQSADHGSKKDDGPPIVAGKELPSSEAMRDQLQERMTALTKKSGLAISPSSTPHITLWASKEDTAKYLPSIKKVEKYFESKCGEPLRSGLDKRAAHIILLKSRYDYEAWIKALIAVIPETFATPDSPGGEDELKAAVLKWLCFYNQYFVVVCTEGRDSEAIDRVVASAVGFMNFAQQVSPARHDALSAGFADGAESMLHGNPTVTIFAASYHNVDREQSKEPAVWIALVKQRVRTKKVTPVGTLLKMDTFKMELPQYAEVWSLVGLLAKQPDKLGRLLIELRTEKDLLAAIEKVYDWDEKKLDAAWHKNVLGQGG